MASELTNHVWQSTLFAVAAGLLTVAFRKNRAKVRYWLWFSASIKFFVPFSLLVSLGSHLQWAKAPHKTLTHIGTPAVLFTMERITRPFPDTTPVRSRRGNLDWDDLPNFAGDDVRKESSPGRRGDGGPGGACRSRRRECAEHAGAIRGSGRGEIRCGFHTALHGRELSR